MIYLGWYRICLAGWSGFGACQIAFYPFAEGTLPLNNLLIARLPAMFFMRVNYAFPVSAMVGQDGQVHEDINY